MLAVTLTLSTVISILFLVVGGVVGYLLREYAYQRTSTYIPTHPEMFDENGQIIPDEILSVRFENAQTTKKKFSVTKKLPPNPFIHEILEFASKQRSNAKKVEVLKEHRNDALVSILIWNFDDTVISMLPVGEVPFNKNEAPIGTDHTSLRKEYRNLYHFVKGGNDGLSKTHLGSLSSFSY